MAPATTLDGRVTVCSLDEPYGATDDDELTFYDYIADTHEDAAEEACRRLDWDKALHVLDDRHRTILERTAADISGLEIAGELDVTPARVCQLKLQIGDKIRDCWNVAGSGDVLSESGWRKHTRTYAEQRACRYERRAA
jgi:DNA-directed RNA polymerase specialized sigma subunit